MLILHGGMLLRPSLGLGQAECSFVTAIVFVAIDVQDRLAGAG